MTLDRTIVANGEMANVVATVTTLGANNQAISGANVVYDVQDQSLNAAQDGAYIVSATGTSNETGQSTATVNLGTDKSNRLITVTATAGGRTISRTITLRGTSIDATADPLVDPATSKTIEFTVTDSNGAPIGNTQIIIEGTGLATRTVTTDASGAYSYTYTVPNSPGTTIEFNVTAAGVSKQYWVDIKAPAQVLPPANLTGLTPTLQVNPNVVAINSAGSTANRLQVVAKFENAAGNPIPNVRVVFKLEGDRASSVQGSFSSGGTWNGTPVQTSTSDGKVQTFYIPGATSSPNNTLNIIACYGATDSDALACDNSRKLSQPITIADEAVSVTIGTDGLLIDETASLSYAQQFVIKVVNSAGQPKSGLTVSAQINTIEYLKGEYSKTGTEDWKRASEGTCAKEDLDDDDRLDAGEDLDHDTRLEPIRAYVSLTAPNGWVTNADGLVVVKMSYPKDVASWMRVMIHATSLVGGSEGRASRRLELAVPQDVLQDEADPPFRYSPYGLVVGDVTVGVGGRTMPDGTPITAGTVLTRCQNPD